MLGTTLAYSTPAEYWLRDTMRSPVHAADGHVHVPAALPTMSLVTASGEGAGVAALGGFGGEGALGEGAAAGDDGAVVDQGPYQLWMAVSETSPLVR